MMAEPGHDLTVDLPGRLKKVPPSTKGEAHNLFDAKTMIATMIQRAESHDRDILVDVMRLIGIHHTEGTNLKRVMDQWIGSKELKEELAAMVRIYEISATAPRCSSTPTLKRICESVPHMSFMMSCQIIDTPGLAVRHWVYEKDLGVQVNSHFKMHYYPALIDVKNCSNKALAGFILFNLCTAKSLMKSRVRADTMPISAAFATSCQISSRILADDMAPAKSKERFTEFVKTLPVTPQLLHLVWQTVVGDDLILLTSATAVTPFHERVIKEQPLNLQKWCSLMDEHKVRSSPNSVNPWVHN